MKMEFAIAIPRTCPDLVRIERFFVAPRTMQLGPQQVLLNAEIRFRRALSRQQLESAIDRVKRHIGEQEPTLERIFIDPDAPR
jgi:hypothetical protein